jgi:hypothetical protein
MGRWWSSSASDRRIAVASLATALLLALAGCRGHDGTPSSDGVPAVADDTPTGTLPTPEAAPGTSVTGMPTAPPPAGAAPADAVPVPAEPVAAPTTEPVPLPEDDTAGVAPPADTGAAPTSPAPPPPSPADAAAAANLVTQYVAALGAGAPARAQALWSTTPNDSTVLQLARNAPFDVGIGAATADSGGRVTVPVDVRGKADDGSDRHVIAVYTVQRGPAGNWRIMSATVRDATP